MQDRFSDEDGHARYLLCLLPSIIVNKALQLNDEVEGVPSWEKDITFPKSLGNEVRRWKTLWQSTNSQNSRTAKQPLLALGVYDEDDFLNIYRLVVISCTQPTTTAIHYGIPFTYMALHVLSKKGK